ncbi:MAG: DUF4230 domain-containing protein [Wolinella sp.]
MGFLLRILSPLFIGLGVFVAFFYFVLSPQAREVYMSEFLSKIPLVSNFVTKNYETSLYGVSAREGNLLKSASYAVDFMAFLKDSAGEEYIALYPYVIEAGIDLEKTHIERRGEGAIHELAGAEILSVDSDEKRGVLVIRDEIKEADYESYLKPVKIAFAKRARDIALESGILERANTQALAFMQDSFGAAGMQFISGDSPAPLREYKARFLPIALSMNTQESPTLKQVTEEEAFNIDDTIFTFRDSPAGIALGYIGSYGGTNREFQEEMTRGAIMSFKYIDPIYPQSKAIVSNPARLYNHASVLIDKNRYYLKALTQDSGDLENLAPHLLYLAMSINPAQNSTEGGFLEFSQTYHRAVRAFAKAEWGILGQEIGKILDIPNALDKEGQAEYKVRLLRALYDQWHLGKRALAIGSARFDELLTLDYALRHDEWGIFKESATRKKFYSLIDNQEFRSNLGLYFLQHAKELEIPSDEAAMYASVAMDSGTISKLAIRHADASTLSTLLAKHFKNTFKYMQGMRQMSDNHEKSTYFLVDDLSLYDVRERLKELSIETRGRFVIVARGDYALKGYFALVMSNVGIEVADDLFASLPFNRKRLFGGVYGRLDVSHGVYRALGHKYKSEAIARALEEINKAFRSEQYNQTKLLSSMRALFRQSLISKVQRER